MATEKNKKKKCFIIGLLITFFILFLLAYGPMLYVLMAVLFSEAPPKPQIKYGEFNYSVVYELDGQRKQIDGILVCEYDGISRNLDGNSIRWKTYIKGQEEDRYLITQNEHGKLYLYLPSDARYYMDDPDYELYELNSVIEPWFFWDTFKEDETEEIVILSEEEIIKLYDAKIISWEIEEPIENVYK